MIRRPWALAIALGFVGASGAAADTVIVQMTTVDFEPRFVPAEVTIAPGDVVQWINVDPFLIDHATKSGTGSADPTAGELWDSGILRVDQTFEVTFEEVGDYEYFSVPHEFEGMFGVVHVTTSTNIGDVETSTWGTLKLRFSLILPRDE
jgi:plastocyanin